MRRLTTVLVLFTVATAALADERWLGETCALSRPCLFALVTD